MALTVGDRPIRPLTADDVMRMVEAGILAADDRVELLRGALTEVSPQDPPHAVVVQRLTRWLSPALAVGACDVRVRLPLSVPDPTSLPEPDIAAIERDDAVIAHPTTALLVLEVADSSLRTDTEVKPSLYAAAGVPEYWVVDVRGRRLHIFAEPSGGEYRQHRAVGSGAAAPLSIDVEPLELAELFAGL